MLAPLPNRMREMLQELGLTKNEIRVYEMLLSDGSSLAGKITQKTGIHRRNVYDCLERLLQKGLVGYIKENNRKAYTVTDPESLRDRMAQQQRDLERALPAMLAAYAQQSEKRETLFFRGASGIKQVLQDQISVGKEILVLATSVDPSAAVKHFFPKYQLLRKERSIPTRMLFDANDRASWTKLKQKLPLSRIRFLAGVNRSPLAQYVYGDAVALIVYGIDPIAIVIRQRDVAQGFRDNFETLWKQAKA